MDKPKNIIPTGISGLDNLLGGGLKPNSLVIVAGNPGLGKTTLGAAILYNACKLGLKGLYVSFVEDEEAFLEHMRSIGLDFRPCIEGNSFRFVDAMYVVSWEALTDTLSLIYRYIDEEKFEIVVIDSITAIVQLISDLSRTRELLRNFFSKSLGGSGAVVIALSELPIGTEVVGTGVEEFVADALILLKAKRIHNRMNRIIEVRKVRWAQLTKMTAPFRIIPGKPVEVFAPEHLSGSHLSGWEYKRLLGLCSHGPGGGRFFELRDSSNRRIEREYLERLSRIAGLPKGVSVTLHYRSPSSIAAILTAMVILWEPGERVAVISTSLPGNYLKSLMRNCFNIGDDLLEVYTINPAYYTIGELIGLVEDIVESKRPGLLLFEGMDLLDLMGERDELIDETVNMTLWLREKKVSPVYIYFREPLPEIKGYGGIIIDAEPRKEVVSDSQGRVWQEVRVNLSSSFLNTSFVIRYDSEHISQLCMGEYRDSMKTGGES